MIKFYLKLLFIFLIIGCSNPNPKLNQGTSLANRIDSIVNLSKIKSFNDSIKFGNVIKAMRLSQKNEIDSLTAKSLFQLIKLSYPLKTKDSFLHYYPKALYFSRQIKDTLHIAQIHNFTGYFYQKHQIIDSAYHHFYQGSKYFKFLKNDYQTGKMLLNMAIIQKNKRDYKGSEEVTKEALEYLIKTDRKRFIASAYNNLGIVNDELKKLPISIKYHKKALNIRKLLNEEPILIIESLNNIAAAYKDNENFSSAFAYHDSIYAYKELLKEYPKINAMVIDNLAHTKLLTGNLEGVLKNMEEALSIRQRENHLTGIMVSLLHLSEYYSLVNKPKKSFQYALDAKNLSREYQNFRDVLKALRMLTLNEFGKEDTKFIEEYYSTLDQVKKVENSVADNFARIRFEANEKERMIKQKNKEIERKQTINFIAFLLLSFTIISVISALLYKKNKRKRLEKEFNAGFDIYLIKKYKLTDRNLEFWKSWIIKDTQKEVAEELFRGINAIKSRRKSLKSKINEVEEINGNFDKSKAIKLYNKELDFFRNITKSKK